MKKVFFVTAALVAALSVSSCKTDKCKCTVETTIGGSTTTTETVVDRPDDKKCSDITAEDFVKIGTSSISYKCKNHHD